ncbi:MAG: hypothetical protein JW797_01130 [Bradymonadales bacterium]|nr:hypothetical protein [Bradymonadales bacterium]
MLNQVDSIQIRRLLYAGLGLVFLAACADQGAGCGEEGCSSVPYPIAGPIIDQAVQLRMTPQGFAFVEENAGPIIENVLGTEGLSYCIEPISASGFTICNNPSVNQCTGGTPGCQFDATLEDLQIEPVGPAVVGDPSFLRVSIVLSEIEEIVPLVVPALGQCDHLLVTSYHQTDDTDYFRVELEIYFHIDPVTDRTSISLDNIVIHVEDLEFINTATIGQDDYVACSLESATLAVLAPMLAGFIVDPLEQMVNAYLCISCEGGAPCPPNSICDDEDSLCHYDEETCVPLPLGTEGEIDLAAMMASVNPAMESSLSYLVYVANYADAERSGMSLAAQAGFYAEHDVCVPNQPPPSGTVAKSSQLVSDLTPGRTTYMLGVGVAELTLETALWAVYQSGALCLTVGTDMVEQLTSNTLAMLLRSLPELTEGENVPVSLHLRPTQAPTITLGSGEVTTGDPPTIVEPLITLELTNLFIDFYALMEERTVRLFSLETDLEIPLALTPSEDATGIQVLIGDLTHAVSRVVPRHAELISEDDSRMLAAVLPILLAGATPMLTDALADPFTLPELMGYRLVIDEHSFTSIEEDTMLALYANLMAVPQSKAGWEEEGGIQRGLALARLEAVIGPDAGDIARLESRRRLGYAIQPDDLASEVLLAVDTIGGADGPREYSYRVNGGPWHLYQSGDLMSIRDPVFLLEGIHTIDVRSRVPGIPMSTSRISEPITLTIDLSAPRVTLEPAEEGQIEVIARDTVWPSHMLTMRYRLDGGSFSPSGPLTTIWLPTGEGLQAAELEVVVTDPFGHEGYARRSLTPLSRGADLERSDGPVMGCSAVTPPNGSTAGLWLGVLPLLTWFLVGRRRGSNRATDRRDRAIGGKILGLLLAVLLLAAAGCGDEEGSGPGPVDEGCDNCGPDQICRDNRCVDNVCAEDSECPEGMVCSGNRCVVRTVCTDNSVCPDGQFCVDDDDDGGSECIAVPCDERSDCSVITCDSGLVAECVDNFCACVTPCADGCGDDAFCCHLTNSCTNLPTECPTMSCEVGYGPVMVTPASGDPLTCAITGPVCECQPLPPLPLGDVGAYLSAAAGADGTIYLSAYNRTYGDLMVGVAQQGSEIDWMFVDGLPDSGPVVGNLEGPRGGVAEPGPDAGRYSSIAVGSDGSLHVSYFNRFYRELRYARGIKVGQQWGWTLSTVDEDDWAGLYTSLTLSSTGVPGIAYMVGRYEISAGVWHSQVRYAWADASLPTAWEVETVDSILLREPCGGPCTGTRQCHQETNRCERVLSGSNCVPACGGDQTCFEGETSNQCGTVVPQPTIFSIHGGRGLFVDSARFSDDQVGVVYYDHDRGDLHYNASAGNTFVGSLSQLLDEEGDVGWYPSITIDSEDGVHITYTDMTNWDLKYFRIGSAGPEVVDTGIRGIESEVEGVLVGYDSSLLLRTDGSLQVAYMDATYHDVMIIRRPSGSGWQAPMTILGNEDPYVGAVGFYLNQLLVDGTVVLATYRINTREAVRDVAVHWLE